MATRFASWPLPGELVDAILDLLDPYDLARVTQVCRALRLRAMDNRWWQKFIQKNLPPACGPIGATPLPAHLQTFRDLYVAHEPHWFLPRHKIWLSGPDMVGKIILVRYDPRRGCIEGYQLVAVSRRSQDYAWPYDPTVEMQAFQPEVSVHLDRPVIKLDAHVPIRPQIPRPASSIQDRRDRQLDTERSERPEGQDKGKARAVDEPSDTSSNTSESNHEQPPQKRPKIHIYQPPGTSFSWGAYAQAITTDTPAIDPICPRIRPIVMDLDGSGASAATASHIPSMFTLAAGSSSRIRRQFIFARPLSNENAFHGGMTATPPRRPKGAPPPEPELESADNFAESRRSLHGRNTIPFPQYSIWPPPELPAPHRVRATDISPHHYPRGPVGQPRLRTDISERAFHVRTYMEAKVDVQRAIAMLKPPQPTDATQSTAGPASAEQPPASAAAPVTVTVTENTLFSVMDGSLPNAAPNIRRDALETYATLDPYYYTPTEDRPFRGIFVGDYSVHGCEFLLVHQDDEVIEGGGATTGSQADGEENEDLVPSPAASSPPPSMPSSACPIRLDGESDVAFAQRLRDDRIYQGSIRAIKLTGDPNVPRGEVSFVVPDLGANGLHRVMQEQPFPGVRIFKGKGHVAGTRFVNDRWVEAQLLLISPDRLAMFWVDFGHISFLERVDIDKYMDPLK
ncbi:hypothetical protein SEPCBS57363_006468 [Sporothrix epigloea]|uniref:F-box domain-containing protein n=1 Tax=Sporothrix epigloea TaxID=1892477 RepID=A0ABP0E361_9PEZI